MAPDAATTGDADEDAQADTDEARGRVHPTLSDLTSADLETLDELLDEY